jgi:CubicO group peptidase (beta-lactamase class C family)
LCTPLQTSVNNGSVPGAVGLITRGDRVEVQAAGCTDTDGTYPMARDSIFRIASITKPITAAAVMMLVEDGQITLDDPVGPWLPELASPAVVRTPAGPVDDVVPAIRPITVADLLTFRAGYGFPSDFSLPAVRLLVSELKQGPPQPQLVVAPDEWMAALARIPLLHQPGEAWLYNTCSDILGVLIARVSGRPCPSSWRSGCSGRSAWPIPDLRCRPASSTGSPATTGPVRRAIWSWLTPPAGSVPLRGRRPGLHRR